ncbi:hypothetical protein BCD67_16755 [Oscillatoriales cyanobacterium USR001]|nr:hypothetical protein BCD67_16755 [Oscillatoriales cyanobacterium USR001]
MLNSHSRISIPKFWRSRFLINSFAIAIAGLTIFPNHAKSQPVCPPPQPGEYLLLIVTETPAQQERARRSLPPDVNSTFCRYLNLIVTRIGGFPNLLAVNDAAKRFQEMVGLPTYVVPPGVAAPPPIPTPNPPRVSPQTLGPGYAVLVDYLNQPQLANQIQQTLGRRLDLVSHGQRSYLLAAYTSDQSAAISTMRALSDRGFVAILVNSRQVIINLPAN